MSDLLLQFFRDDSRANRKAPGWARTRSSMTSFFPTYHDRFYDKFAQEIAESVRSLNDLKPSKKGPAYLGNDPSIPDYTEVAESRVEEEPMPLEEVVQDSVELFEGMPHWSHPFAQMNVIPPANKASIIAATLSNIMSPNIIEGEYAWNVEKAEMESAAMLAELIGWDPEVAGGLYTYGGSGCYFYGIKYALTQVFGSESRCTGIREDGKILVSQQGHYAKMNSTDWSGLGMNNIVEIETDDDSNAMDLGDLEDKMKHFHRHKIPIVSVICTMGTTDAFAIDDVKEVRRLCEKYPNPPKYGKTFIYCDAVIGWSWLMFSSYDFERNHLGFSDKVVKQAKANFHHISKVVHADGIGIDFHKTGWCTYNCSMFMMKDLNHFRGLMTRPGSAYLQERTKYNPGLYTLEVSRSGSYALSGWATLKYFGLRGFQSMLGGILEVKCFLRHIIAKEKSIVCVNKEDHGFVTLFRSYPPGINAEEQYEKEVSRKRHEGELTKHNELQEKIANFLWKWYRTGEKIDGMYGPYTSFTTGFRTTDYSDDLSSPNVIYAIKSFPMNVNITPQHMVQLLEMVKIATKRALAGEGTIPGSAVDPEETVKAPYDKPNPAVSCNDEQVTAGKARVGDMLSGVVGSRAHTRLKKQSQ